MPESDVSPDVARAIHADAVRLARSEFLSMLPWLVPSGLVLAFGFRYRAFLVLGFWSLVVAFNVVRLGVRYALLRRETPAAMLEAERRVIVIAGRRPGAPVWLRKGGWSTLGATALFGLLGFSFIDNAGHAGGTLMGMLIGWISTSGSAGANETNRTPVLDALGWASAAIISAGVVITAGKLLRL